MEGALAVVKVLGPAIASADTGGGAGLVDGTIDADLPIVEASAALVPEAKASGVMELSRARVPVPGPTEAVRRD